MEFVTAAAQSTASSLVGSASGSAAEKGAAPPAMDKQPQSVKIGLKASEILVSSIMTSIAVTLFSQVSRYYKGYSFVLLAVSLSSVAAVAAAYIKIKL